MSLRMSLRLSRSASAPADRIGFHECTGIGVSGTFGREASGIGGGFGRDIRPAFGLPMLGRMFLCVEAACHCRAG